MADVSYIDKTKQKTVGIIGGGRAGLQLFELFHNSHQTRVAYLVDPNADAPAVVAARKAGIPTFTDSEKAVQNTVVDVLIEVCGVDEIVNKVKVLIQGTDTRLITHDAAFILLSVIQESNQSTKDSVAEEINNIQSEITRSLTGIEKLVGAIDEIAGDMRMLALNARIEAARVGDEGRGFTVVAGRMQESADRVHEITTEIDQVNANILDVSGRIEGALQRLK